MTEPLSPEDLTAYHENGFLLVRNLISRQEAAAMREECHALAARLDSDADPTWASARTVAGASATRTSLKHAHDAQFHSAAFARLLVDPRFTDVAAALLGGPNVQLHHTKMFIKPPETGSPFPLHQDHPFFPHARHTVAAAVFHFDDAPEEKGCIRAVPGSHRRGPLPHVEEGSWHLPPDTWPLRDARPCPAEAGDVPVLQLSHRARLGVEHLRRGPHHLAGTVPRSGGPAHRGRAHLVAGPGHDPARHRPHRAQDGGDGRGELTDQELARAGAAIPLLNGVRLGVTLAGRRVEFVDWGFYPPEPWRNFRHSHSYFELCYAYAGRGTFRTGVREHPVGAA